MSLCYLFFLAFHNESLQRKGVIIEKWSSLLYFYTCVFEDSNESKSNIIFSIRYWVMHQVSHKNTRSFIMIGSCIKCESTMETLVPLSKLSLYNTTCNHKLNITINQLLTHSKGCHNQENINHQLILKCTYSLSTLKTL